MDGIDGMDVEKQAQAALRLFMTPRRRAPRDWEAALLQQRPPFAFANGLVARTWGDGPRVLLVHGWEERGVNLGGFIAPLVDAGYQAIALDGPAHGESPGEMTNPPHFAQGLLGVASELGPLAGVIAHSFGGMGTAVALRQGLVAQRVVLMASPSSTVAVLRQFARTAQLPQPVAARFYQLVDEQAKTSAEALNIARIGARLTTPALIIHDAADTYIPFADAQAIAASWPAAQLYVTEGLGHGRILRDPAVIATAVSFLTSNEEATTGEGRIA